MPMASTRPNRLKALIEKPSTYNAANVPTIDTGTAINGMIEARQVCRNRITTSTTRAMASSSVVTTALIESRTKMVVSYTASYFTSAGKVFCISSIVAITASRISSALAPGAWKMPMPTAFLPSSCERSV
ncbi:hypothetical protein D3C71_1734500 [compost metagenome]